MTIKMCEIHKFAYDERVGCAFCEQEFEEWADLNHPHFEFNDSADEWSVCPPSPAYDYQEDEEIDI